MAFSRIRSIAVTRPQNAKTFETLPTRVSHNIVRWRDKNVGVNINERTNKGEHGPSYLICYRDLLKIQIIRLCLMINHIKYNDYS